MTAQQLELFDMALPNAETVQVSVFRNERGYYATIAGGWWCAYGATPEQAAQRCFNEFENERNATIYGLGAWV